jgi:hypothetical protein
MHVVAIIGLSAGFVCALLIGADVVRHPQRMGIMNLVWPLTGLFGTVLWLWAYFTYGRRAVRDVGRPEDRKNPFAVSVAIGASHCGSGCALGDICAEWLAFGTPAVAVALGYLTIFSDKVFAVWILDYAFAFSFGILFQYFSIAPMHEDWSISKALWVALKADTLSLTAWQVGMYGYMAVAKFLIFRQVFGADLPVASAEFWFMMQIAMLFGFATAYPVNWWLIRSGIKPEM